MSATDGVPSDALRRRDEDIVQEHELIRLAGFDLEHYLGLPDYQQRLVLKMAEQLVDAARRAHPET